MTGKVQKGWWVEEDSDVLVIIGPRSGHVRSGKKGVWEVAKIDNACFWDDPAIEAIDRANARLIAAAPDLLAACNDALHGLRIDAPERVDEIDALEAAIAKAEGKP